MLGWRALKARQQRREELRTFTDAPGELPYPVRVEQRCCTEAGGRIFLRAAGAQGF